MLSRLLTSPLPPPRLPTLADWQRRHQELTRTQFDGFDAAMLVAVGVDRLGWAFASGYQAALRLVVPGLAPDRLVALCVTEPEGNHPRQIHTTVAFDDRDAYLSGHKSFVTFGTQAQLLLVVAREGADAASSPRLRLARVPADRAQAQLAPLDELPLCPEVPHAALTLTHLRLPQAEVDGGDAFTAVVRPFRTAEDCVVTAAALAYLVGVGRRHGWPQERLEAHLGLIAALRELARGSLTAVGNQLALAGVMGLAHPLLDPRDPLWQQVDPAEHARYVRDAPLLQVAGRAREARRARAWASALAAASPPPG